MADLTESFWFYAKDGARYQAHIYHVRIDTSQLDGEPSSMPGLKKVRLTTNHYFLGRKFGQMKTK